MDIESKRLLARVNALEIALTAAVKNDPDALSAVREALGNAYDLAVKEHEVPVRDRLPTSVRMYPRAAPDQESESLRISTLADLRRKLG